MRNIGQDLGSIDHHFKAYAEDTDTASRTRALNRIKDQIRAIEETLPNLRATAAKDNVGDDPRVTGVEPEFAEIKAKLARLQTDTQAQATASAAAKGAAKADIATLRKAYDRLQVEYFHKAAGKAIYFNDIEDAEKLLALVEKFERTDKAPAQTRLNDFSAKYGSTRQDLEAKTGISQAAYPFEGIRDGIENVAKTREAMAEDLASRAEERIGGLSGLSDFYRIDGHGAVRETGLRRPALRCAALRPGFPWAVINPALWASG